MQMQLFPRTLTTKNGDSVTTQFTDEEAMSILRKRNDPRDRWLTSARSLSPDQLTWVHIRAVAHANGVEYKSSQRSLINLNDVSGIRTLFGIASQRLKFPKIRLRLDNRPVVLHTASERSKYRGQIIVTNGEWGEGNVYFGRIDEEGIFRPSSRCLPALTDLIRRLAADPTKVAREYGQQYNTCCFCGKRLKDDRSVRAGFGPDCASHFGLDW